jgi:hypothetical protein
MTLEHIRLVNFGIVRTIESLVKDITPQHKASTARVKPDPTADESVRLAYENSCDAVLATAAAAPNLKTKARFAHPWFGSLDANGWHAMAGSHISVHRKQIARILKGLPATSPQPSVKKAYC